MRNMVLKLMWYLTFSSFIRSMILINNLFIKVLPFMTIIIVSLLFFFVLYFLISYIFNYICMCNHMMTSTINSKIA